jgi:hypothetical protein
MDNGGSADNGHQTDNAYGVLLLSAITCQQRNHDVGALNRKHVTHDQHSLKGPLTLFDLMR